MLYGRSRNPNLVSVSKVGTKSNGISRKGEK
jgi:hypothetical protein